MLWFIQADFKQGWLLRQENFKMVLNGWDTLVFSLNLESGNLVLDWAQFLVFM